MSTNAILVPVEARRLSELSTVTHGFFTRIGGVSVGLYESLNAGLGSGDDRQAVIENRTRMARHLGAKGDQIVSPYQVHSADVHMISEPWSGDRPEADAVVTGTPGLGIGVVTADCGPVLFAEPEAAIVAAAHAGWKGAASGILENTITTMEAAGARRERIIAVLGPTISQENYEVGPEFQGRFVSENRDNERFFVPSRTPRHHMFDLPAYILHRLGHAGVKASWTGDCTYENDERFYSFRRTTHRRQTDYGRQLSAIMLRP